MRSTFKVLFYLKRNAPKKNGLIPVMCRITVNGKIAQFSCKLDVEEKSWNVKSGRVSGRSIVAQEANRMLDKIRVGIDRAYQQISDRDHYVTAEKVRNAYLGLGMNHETLLAVFRQHNEDYEKQVGKLKSLRSYWNIASFTTPRGVRRKAVQGQRHCAQRAYSGIHHGLRVVPASGKESLQQHGLVLYDAVPENNLYGRQ